MGIEKLVKAAFLNDNASIVYIANNSIIAKYQDKPDEKIGTYATSNQITNGVHINNQIVLPNGILNQSELGGKDYYEKTVALSSSVSVKLTVMRNKITNTDKHMVIMMERLHDAHHITWIDDDGHSTSEQCHDAIISALGNHGITLIRGKVNTGKTTVTKAIISGYMELHPCAQVVYLEEQAECVDVGSVITMNPRGHDARYMARIVLKLHPSVVIIDSNSELANEVLFTMIDMDGSIARRYVVQENPEHDDGATHGTSRFINTYRGRYPGITTTAITTIMTEYGHDDVHASMNDMDVGRVHPRQPIRR